MAEIKELEKIVAKWVKVAPTRAEDYAEGVKSPRRDWETAAKSAESAWAQAVQEAAAKKRFSAGIDKAGTEKWQNKALTLGTRRWPEGIAAAPDEYARGFAPYAEEIKRTTLPPRFPRGDPRNLERVKVIATALNKRRMGVK